MKIALTLLVAGATALLITVALNGQEPPAAFEGAEGFGAHARGGAGGQTIEVTSLADSGPGSLRAALEARGPRIVEFRVSGTINLQRRLEVRDPFVTVAGETAPGEGITLRGPASQAGSASDSSPRPCRGSVSRSGQRKNRAP